MEANDPATYTVVPVAASALTVQFVREVDELKALSSAKPSLLKAVSVVFDNTAEAALMVTLEDRGYSKRPKEVECDEFWLVEVELALVVLLTPPEAVDPVVPVNVN